MGPKKALLTDEADEIKKSLDFLTEEVPAVRLPQEKTNEHSGSCEGGESSTH